MGEITDLLDLYDKVNADPKIPNMPDELMVAYTSEVGRILVSRPSPAAVADALSRRLESIAGPAERAALAWLASELGSL